MKRVVFGMVTLLSFFYLTSCQESTQGVDLRKNWQYSGPYVEFTYSSDTIHFGSGTNQMNMSVQDLKNMVWGMAGSKMRDYFKGIDIYSWDTLVINAQRATGEIMKMKAAYFNDANYIEMDFDRKVLGAILGGNANMIPKISFQYMLQEGQLIIFLNEVYVQTIFENLQIQKMITPMIVRKLNPMFDRMPAPAQQAMLTGVQEQLSAIIDNFQEMRMGFILK